MTDLLLIPGAFDPLHYGHLGLAQEAEAISGREATFLLTRRDTDLVQFGSRKTRESGASWTTFELLDRFPGAHVAVGATALERDLLRQGHWSSSLDAASARGSRVYVSPRVVGERRILSMADVLDQFFGGGAIPSGFVALAHVYNVTSYEMRVARQQVRRQEVEAVLPCIVCPNPDASADERAAADVYAVREQGVVRWTHRMAPMRGGFLKTWETKGDAVAHLGTVSPRGDSSR